MLVKLFKIISLISIMVALPRVGCGQVLLQDNQAQPLLLLRAPLEAAKKNLVDIHSELLVLREAPQFQERLQLVVVLLAMDKLPRYQLEPTPAVDVTHLKTKDPRFSEVLLYFSQGNYLSSLAHLSAFEKMQKLSTPKEDSDFLLGVSQLSYGMNNEARESFGRILANKKYSQRSRDMAALHLAQIYYTQGAWEDENNILSSMEDVLPARLKREKNILRLNLLIFKNRLQEAEKILSELDGEREIDILSWYGRHNLAMVMLNNGQLQQGIRILRKISEESFDDIERRALQDKTNLALGYAYLQAGDMNSAIGYFEKIRIKSPFSSRALLGLGLSEVALSQYQRALSPWLELQKGDMREPEVQEALLMIPETLFKLESYKRARSDYQHAISRYKVEIDAISSAIEATRAGKITTNIFAKGMLEEHRWNDFLGKPPAIPEARYFTWFMRDESFRKAISLYKEARNLRDAIRGQKESLSGYGLSNMVTTRYTEMISKSMVDVDATINKIDAYIQILAINWLENRRVSLNSYLSQANLGLAKVYHHAAERGDQ